MSPSTKRTTHARSRNRACGDWFRPRIEVLEDRRCPSASYLLVSDWGRDSVLRYDGTTGAFVDTFVPRPGLDYPYGILFGPHDQDLYVSTGEFGGQTKSVFRFDGTTGAFIDEFAVGGDLKSPRGIIFGPDGNLYVSDRNLPSTDGRIARFDGLTGAYMDDFVPVAGGGLKQPSGLVFGPSGRGRSLDLYVASGPTASVKRYDGLTGAFLGDFVPGGAGGLVYALALTFGPDGNLYVASGSFDPDRPSGAILRYQGPSGHTPGAFIDAFVPIKSGEMQTPLAVLFGPDGNGDGRLDLYVGNSKLPGAGTQGKNATVKRYDGLTGAFLDTFVPFKSGKLDDVGGMTFTETDPITLVYRAEDHLTAASPATDPIAESLDSAQVQPLLAEAIARWQATGQVTSQLAAIDVRIVDFPGNTLGSASGHTIWLDTNAAGWGWFVDRTPWDDSEFYLPGDQGEQIRMDLLTALEHELGHLYGHEHADEGLMAKGLRVGTRQAVYARLAVDEPYLFSDEPTSLFPDPHASDTIFALMVFEEYGLPKKKRPQ
jgi:hypothetical protein